MPDNETHDKPFKVRIIWGSEEYRKDAENNADEYAFATEVELAAFLEGVDAAVGFLDRIQIEPNADGTWPDDAWQAKLKPGDKFRWNDDDEGRSTGEYQIQSIKVDLEDQTVSIETVCGTEVDAPFSELQKVEK